MDLVPGEYVFTCPECEGDGNVQVINGDPECEAETVGDHCTNGCCGLFWETCEDCDGRGETLGMDEEEAAEWIEGGRTPLRTP